jgi:hypothetical protein
MKIYSITNKSNKGFPVITYCKPWSYQDEKRTPKEWITEREDGTLVLRYPEGENVYACIDRKGSKWPDNLTEESGGGDHSLYVTEQVISDIENELHVCIDKFELFVDPSANKILKKIKMPKYYLVRPKVVVECTRFEPEDPSLSFIEKYNKTRLFFRKDNLSSSPLFMSHWKHAFCTEEFIEFVTRKNYTNFTFNPFPVE